MLGETMLIQVEEQGHNQPVEKGESEQIHNLELA